MADEGLRDELRAFVDERDWGQFHSQENLAKSISIEAAELLECFQWQAEADDSRVRSELADVLTYCFLLADRLGTAPETLIREKLAITKAKYPVERSRGRSTKYDQL
ncbi:nucleotide pyrophosphohydrolase [Curtobacterium sp. MCLR17_044]|uniref:nucleotide pyrophosphohydrolase n=1 Tax=Curtobacterium sp. MCLR17_044 TaxID=2175628 RepID=UPI000DA97F38|nr:nucleotide pyrophosphohydrolase [Curtobacterium sp. MCLR17_044]PZE56162.1 nucleotide pyrophosphohydrolase [Curtobacterium sp. MCLR17_044]